MSTNQILTDVMNEQMEERLEALSQEMFHKAFANCTKSEIYNVVLQMTKDMIDKVDVITGDKKVYYISAEFLIGKLLSNNLINLGIYDKLSEVLEKNGVSLAEIEEVEPEPSLGNGGLGRLAACFLDSIATLGLPGDGIGLNYHFGLFKQVFKDRIQCAEKNDWIEENSWLRKTDVSYDVYFGDKKVKSRLYATLANRGYFPVEELTTLRKLGSHLQGHPCMQHTPGVDMSSGSLGQGISVATGMALSAKLSNDDYRVYTLLGDGEIAEGQVWEAAMFAGFKKLDNLVVIVDNNGLQIDGRIEDVCDPNPIPDKFKAFNFHVIEIDGHDFDQIRAAFKEAKETKGMPTAIIAKTTKGKGVSFMEDQAGWHGKAPNDEQYAQAMEELEKAGEALCQK